MAESTQGSPTHTCVMFDACASMWGVWLMSAHWKYDGEICLVCSIKLNRVGITVSMAETHLCHRQTAYMPWKELDNSLWFIFYLQLVFWRWPYCQLFTTNCMDVKSSVWIMDKWLWKLSSKSPRLYRVTEELHTFP